MPAWLASSRRMLILFFVVFDKQILDIHAGLGGFVLLSYLFLDGLVIRDGFQIGDGGRKTGSVLGKCLF